MGFREGSPTRGLALRDCLLVFGQGTEHATYVAGQQQQLYFLLFDFFPRYGGIQHRGSERLGLLPAEGCLNCEDQWKVWEAPLGDGGDLGVPVRYTFVHFPEVTSTSRARSKSI